MKKYIVWHPMVVSLKWPDIIQIILEFTKDRVKIDQDIQLEKMIILKLKVMMTHGC